MALYLLSWRGLYSSVAQDSVYELEDLIARTCSARFLVPTAKPIISWLEKECKIAARTFAPLIRNTIGYFTAVPGSSLDLDEKDNVLLIIASSGLQLNILSSINNWRIKFDNVIAYVQDPWEPRYYPRYANKIDYLFVPLPEVVEPLKKYFSIKVALMPLGADVLANGSCQIDRPFDLTSYGRIPEKYNVVFNKEFNRRGSAILYHRQTPRTAESLPAIPYEQRTDMQDRELFWNILRRSKLATAFDTLQPSGRVFQHSVATMRWFECGAAGCVIVGKKPVTPIADKLFPWNDSTIELPDDPQESIKTIESLLHDNVRLASICKKNYFENLSRNDWRFRIRDILQKSGVAIPEILANELAVLENTRAKAQY